MHILKARCYAGMEDSMKENAYLKQENSFGLVQGELQEEIVASHCGHASDGMVQMMINAQHTKMHLWPKKSKNGKKSVLIVGTGHTRKKGFKIFPSRGCICGAYG